MNLVSSLSVHVSLPYTVSTVHVFVSLFASYVYTCCIKNVKQLEKEACCCQLCSELPPHGVLFLHRLLAKTSIGLVDPFMHLLVIPGVQFRCARYERTPTREQADHFSDVATREFVPARGHNVPSDVSLKQMFCSQLSVCCHCHRIKHTQRSALE